MSNIPGYGDGRRSTGHFDTAAEELVTSPDLFFRDVTSLERRDGRERVLPGCLGAARQCLPGCLGEPPRLSPPAARVNR